ncbi:MAG TPA: type II toxin-antitoxin system HicB family antitoxin [Chlamydiales bacterium]|jgi:predicted RNase H-like HicB family nuclease|nr:type II toxin-antitoxin system HicB family antitoxin [Chlamydiales bacterium]
MSTKKNLKYYLGLNWSFTVEQEDSKGHRYFIIRVNELPGVCTDAETIEEGMVLIKEAIEAAVKLYLKNGETVPEPIKKSNFKGNIAYRTTSERHYYVAKAAKELHKSISKTIDDLIDAGIEKLHIVT